MDLYRVVLGGGGVAAWKDGSEWVAGEWWRGRGERCDGGLLCCVGCVRAGGAYPGVLCCLCGFVVCIVTGVRRGGGGEDLAYWAQADVQ